MQKSITPDNIKDQYSKGPQPQKEEQLTPEQLRERREQQDKKLDEILPFLKKQEEYDRLQMSLTEMDVLMGRVPISQVPGLLGLELRVREVQAQGFLMQWAEGQRRAMEEHAKNQAMSEEEKKAREEFDKLSPEEQARVQQEAVEAYQKAQKQAEINNMAD